MTNRILISERFLNIPVVLVSRNNFLKLIRPQEILKVKTFKQTGFL